MDSLRGMNKSQPRSPGVSRKASGEGNMTQVQVKVSILGTVFWTAPPGPCVVRPRFAYERVRFGCSPSCASRMRAHRRIASRSRWTSTHTRLALVLTACADGRSFISEVCHIARSYADIRMLHEQLTKQVRGYAYELPHLLEEGKALSRHFITRRSHADLLEVRTF